jgi:hypothetical protein
MTSQSWHVSERIECPADEVYAYASNPANLPRWAPGLGNSVEEADGQWFVDTPAERVRLAFAPQNDFGVLDHYLTLNSGEVIYVPMRVMSGRRCRGRRPGKAQAGTRGRADLCMTGRDAELTGVQAECWPRTDSRVRSDIVLYSSERTVASALLVCLSLTPRV